MKKLRPRSAVLSILALAAVVWMPSSSVAADSGKTISSSTTPPSSAQSQNAESVGRYRRQGAYRSEGRYHGSKQAAKPRTPSYNHLNKYYQLKPLEEYAARPFVGNLSRSELQPFQQPSEPCDGCVEPSWLAPLPPVVYLPSEPRHEQPSPPPAPPQPPQVYIIQPPAPAVRAEPVWEPPPRPEPAAEPRSPVELRLTIRPAEAEVFLDDHFLGSGNELSARSKPLVLPPGVHVLEVDHPDHPPQRLIFGLGSDSPVKAVIDLTIQRPGRRARIETREDYGFDS
ncbi:MAG: hypothetical protein GY856_23385 [bacterium]|nr:hypothetical protein [bacterium]